MKGRKVLLPRTTSCEDILEDDSDISCTDAAGSSIKARIWTLMNSAPRTPQQMSLERPMRRAAEPVPRSQAQTRPSTNSERQSAELEGPCVKPRQCDHEDASVATAMKELVKMNANLASAIAKNTEAIQNLATKINSDLSSIRENTEDLSKAVSKNTKEATAAIENLDQRMNQFENKTEGEIKSLLRRVEAMSTERNAEQKGKGNSCTIS